ncbi:MAG: hypothetical protein LCH92_08085 [Proteobacteria bacterium]|nr:hypothetical protein [Pseudomonadota bacterium]
MPLTDLTYSRPWTFVEQYDAGDEAFRAAFDAQLNDLVEPINVALGSGLRFVGTWSAASGAFPDERPDQTDIRARDAWVVTLGGAVDDVSFARDEVLVALVDDAGPTYSGNWLRIRFATLAIMQEIADQISEDADQVAEDAEQVSIDRGVVEAARDIAVAAANKLVAWRVDFGLNPGETELTLTAAQASLGSDRIRVFIGGVAQRFGHAWTLDEATITFAEALPDEPVWAEGVTSTGTSLAEVEELVGETSDLVDEAEARALDSAGVAAARGRTGRPWLFVAADEGRPEDLSGYTSDDMALDALLGPSVEIAGGGSHIIAHREWVPLTNGRVYEARFDGICAANSSGISTVAYLVETWEEDGTTNVETIAVRAAAAISVADGRVQIAATLSQDVEGVDHVLDADGRLARAKIATEDADTDGVWRFAEVWLEDVTDRWRAETAAESAGVDADRAEEAANLADSEGNATAAQEARLGAEAALDAASELVAVDYSLALTADLDDLTPTTGETAWISSTGHFWHFDGSDWVDDGLGFLHDFRAVFDLLSFQGDDDLMVFAEAMNKIFGRVDKGALWHIALAKLGTADFELVYYEINDPLAPPIIATDADLKVLWAAPAPGDDASAEVVAARGSAPDLGTRLDASLSPSGVTLAPQFGRETLRNCHYKMIKCRLGEATQINIAAIGDSYTQAAVRWTGPAAQLLMAQYGDAGGGWTGYGWYGGAGGPWVYPGTQPSGINGNVRPSSYTLHFHGAWATVYNGSDGPDLSHVSSSTAGAYVRRAVPASPDHTALRVVYIGTADGVVRHRVDGGSWTSQNVQGTVDAVQTFDIALTAGAHVIEIEVVSGTVKLCGDNALSDASGVRFHKLGGSGSNISQWTARDEAQQRAGWEVLEVDTFTVLDGTNSQVVMSPETWAGHAETLIERLRAAAAVPDILLAMPPENMRENTYPMALYAAQAREIAAAEGIAFRDFQRDFGLVPADYASTSDRPLFNADGIHPEPPNGGRVLQFGFLEMLEA